MIPTLTCSSWLYFLLLLSHILANMNQSCINDIMVNNSLPHAQMVLSLASKHLWLTAHSPAVPIDIIMIPPSTCAQPLDDGTLDIVFVLSEHRSVLLCKLVHPGLLGLPFSSHTAKSFRPSAMALQWKHGLHKVPVKLLLRGGSPHCLLLLLLMLPTPLLELEALPQGLGRAFSSKGTTCAPAPVCANIGTQGLALLLCIHGLRKVEELCNATLLLLCGGWLLLRAALGWQR